MAAVGTDLLIVERSGTLYKAAASEVAALASGGTIAAAQVSNTDTTTNLNLNGNWRSVPITGTTVFADTGFTVSGNGIACGFTGRIEVTGSLFLAQGGSSTRLDVTIAKNGTAFGPIVQSTYSRASTVRGSAFLSHVMTVETDDVIGLLTQKNDGFSTAEMATAGTSFLTIKRLS